jgi:Rrf2 family protein
MKLSHASAYALHALAHLAGDRAGDPVVSRHIAQAHGLPGQYLQRSLGALASAGVLRSVKGPNGGYRLARPADKITLLEVVEAVDGPIRGQPPWGDGPPDVLTERLRAICEDVAAQVRKVLGRVRLSDLAGAAGGKKG